MKSIDNIKIFHSFIKIDFLIVSNIDQKIGTTKNNPLSPKSCENELLNP